MWNAFAILTMKLKKRGWVLLNQLGTRLGGGASLNPWFDANPTSFCPSGNCDSLFLHQTFNGASPLPQLLTLDTGMIRSMSDNCMLLIVQVWTAIGALASRLRALQQFR
jgi:hypothetical protein